MDRIVHCSGCNNVIPVPDHIKAATLACPQCKAPFANPHLAPSSQAYSDDEPDIVSLFLPVPATSKAAPIFAAIVLFWFGVLALILLNAFLFLVIVCSNSVLR